eukprot:6478866-Amphidinium_carterae.1
MLLRRGMRLMQHSDQQTKHMVNGLSCAPTAPAGNVAEYETQPSSSGSAQPKATEGETNIKLTVVSTVALPTARQMVDAHDETIDKLKGFQEEIEVLQVRAEELRRSKRKRRE